MFQFFRVWVRMVWVSCLFIIGCFSALWAQPNPCEGNEAFRIVVLGSSTAAGAGASTSDSAWVNRYRNFLQNLNPGSEVLNLARGGYSTFQLMPTGFVPPPGKPAPDTIRNITQALQLSPDGIIINLPSNDAGQNNSPATQLANFDSMLVMAAAQSVPIWICTTQPRNFNNASQLQIQLAMRDSILNRYAPLTLDFWNGIADPTVLGWIDPAYDSGDGVHLNDAGHGILANRVIDAHLPAALFQPSETVDISTAFTSFPPTSCGDSLQEIGVQLANLGGADSRPLPLVLTLQNLNSGSLTLLTDTLPQVPGSCEADTVFFEVNTWEAGQYEVRIWHELGDNFPENDSLSRLLTSLGHPSLFLPAMAACPGDSLTLLAQPSSGDTVLWYADPWGDSLLTGGNEFGISSLDSNQTVYAQAVRGDLFFRDSLSGSETSGIHWNGFMFDLLAHTDLILDSLSLRIFDPGFQEIEMYVKAGSYQGAELQPTAWTLLSSDSVWVPTEDAWTRLQPDSLSLAANDTLGVYLQLVDPGARLSYEFTNQPETFSSPELSLLNGSGISHEFSALFFPRSLNLHLFFHHGFRKEGDCATPILPAFATVSVPNLGLADTIQLAADSVLLLEALVPAAYSCEWSNAAGQSLAEADSSGWFFAHCLDSLGCAGLDSVFVWQLPASPTGIVDVSPLQSVVVFPNPFQENLTLAGTRSGKLELRCYDLQGRELLSRVQQVGETWELTCTMGELPPGLYLLQVRLGEEAHWWKLQKQ